MLFTSKEVTEDINEMKREDVFLYYSILLLWVHCGWHSYLYFRQFMYQSKSNVPKMIVNIVPDDIIIQGLSNEKKNDINHIFGLIVMTAFETFLLLKYYMSRIWNFYVKTASEVSFLQSPYVYVSLYFITYYSLRQLCQIFLVFCGNFIITATYQFNLKDIIRFLQREFGNFIQLVATSISWNEPRVLIINYTGNLYCLFLWLLSVSTKVLRAVTLSEILSHVKLGGSVDELCNPQLRMKIENITSRLNFPTENINFLYQPCKNDSFATNQAQLVGLFNARIFVSIQNVEDDELIAALAHEIGHWKLKHGVQMIAVYMIASSFEYTLIFVLLQLTYVKRSFHFSDDTSIVVLIALCQDYLLLPYEYLYIFLENWMIQQDEYEADHFAAAAIDKRFLRSALIKLQAESRKTFADDWAFYTYTKSHGRLIDRLQKLS